MTCLLSRRKTAGILLGLSSTSRGSSFLHSNRNLLRNVNSSTRASFSSVLVSRDSCAVHAFQHTNHDNPLCARKDRGSEKSQGQKQQRSSSSGSKQKKKSKKNKLFRADKVIASRASLSRSQATDVLKRRRVALKKTEGSELIPVKGPKEKLAMDTILYMDGKPIPQLPPILIAYHKPKFMLSAMDEKHSNKKHLGMILPDQYKKLGFHPVGRLDYDTCGLLLFSMDGELTQRLLHPKHSVEKEYVATVSGGEVNVEILKSQLEVDGVVTGEGLHFAKLLDVESISLDESKVIVDEHLQGLGEDEEDFHSGKIDLPLTNVRIKVEEGKYRMVRRMLANCKHPVIELRRERHGSIELSDLEEGCFRHCGESETEWAESLLL